MKMAVLALVLCLSAGAARASPVSYVPGTGPPNVLPPDRDVFWYEPPDLNGLIGSSEQIFDLGIETELANDFVVSNSSGMGGPIWWGGFYNNSTPCASGVTTPGFNLRVYRDGGCVPDVVIADISVTDFTEESVGCQSGTYPLFRWSAPWVNVPTPPGVYWFGAQMKNHAFPPQGGRLATALITGCDAVFRSVYFGYPDWTPVIDVFGVARDFSQEFGSAINPIGACCVGDQGECHELFDFQCDELKGHYKGDNTQCDPNPCGLAGIPGDPTKSTTWGRIKGGYR